MNNGPFGEQQDFGGTGEHGFCLLRRHIILVQMGDKRGGVSEPENVPVRPW
jgi:hypothetical protein